MDPFGFKMAAFSTAFKCFKDCWSTDMKPIPSLTLLSPVSSIYEFIEKNQLSAKLTSVFPKLFAWKSYG